MHMLVCLADEGSFTATAERLHITQQAISAQVKRLEELTGRNLITRSTQSVRLTQDGEALLVYARQVVAITERVRLRFSSIPLEGSVRFGFTPGFGQPLLFPLLSEIKRLHPKLELYCETMRTTALVSRLESGNLDVIIGAQRNDEKRGETLLRDKLVWIGDAATLVRPGSPVPLVMLPRPSFLRDHVFAILDMAELGWTVFFESDDPTAVRAAVLSGWGVSLVNSLFIVDDAAFAQSPPEGLLPDAGYIEFFLRFDDRRNDSVGPFAAVLRSVLGELRTGLISGEHPSMPGARA